MRASVLTKEPSYNRRTLKTIALQCSLAYSTGSWLSRAGGGGDAVVWRTWERPLPRRTSEARTHEVLCTGYSPSLVLHIKNLTRPDHTQMKPLLPLPEIPGLKKRRLLARISSHLETQAITGRQEVLHGIVVKWINH